MKIVVYGQNIHYSQRQRLSNERERHSAMLAQLLNRCQCAVGWMDSHLELITFVPRKVWPHLCYLTSDLQMCVVVCRLIKEETTPLPFPLTSHAWVSLYYSHFPPYLVSFELANGTD